ncbi:CCA tRNA nucleotidyltransferase [Nocardia cyriacigeorgica]|uniref:CCA tRNA nucleotidyltransferase n=1 Tax=Nocardia cyriacigeorgica TaxID=135487 RepID=UPI0018934C65|nr:CCA tRNA nucleotidyltransferase [Nocardia cyriacigeorgica]MBF6086045.1 CCA tRNA nucleotidyltransferase [Nocardia cyriacigeorgica]MBF6092135.1 CCA tRNA nucleotidyltransferase [Nocardia cyriacigeorgica]MBF6315569.1 CCA tRNA nucleotidyltransferase [Nocardia cyriacigeorgica]MBF6342902.1 CCA tRNA nucleotidyltransferase [Nocardia cyriacigeorgica]MBF6394218.1 CCA tRNA nucleotidyltransferase [Nocardia cyriacigeorgica]
MPAQTDHAQLAPDERRTRLLAAAAVTLGSLGDVLTPLGELFAARGFQLYLVGGSVRDAVLGRLGTDLDFTTDARPEQVQQMLRGWADHLWDTGGLAFGTVSAAKGDQQLEITTFRSDAYDRVSRNPEVTFGDSLEGDLVRRDFTVNAMAVKIGADGALEFVDPLGGMDALLAGVLDTPSTPQESFGDDPLRMLRAARFVSQLGFALHPRVQEAITEMAGEIERITAERVRTELDKLIAGAHPIDGINIMCETGLAQIVLPEVPAMKLEIDEHHQHKDVYWHSLTVLEQAIDQEEGDPDLVLRWAALLHDIGKPDTKRNEPGGGVSFHHHEVVGAKMVRKRMRALKYPKQFTEDVARLVFLHLRFHGYGKGQWTDSAVRRYVTDAGELLPRLHKLVRADCTTRNKRRAAALRATYDDLEQRIARLQEQEDLDRVRPDLDGNAIMELLGLKPGPEVGKAWKYLKELRLDRGPLTREEAEAALLEWWKSQQ